MSFRFGDHVLIRAFLVRVLGNPERQVFSAQTPDLDGTYLKPFDEWPGTAVPLEWAPARTGVTLDLEPPLNGRLVARARRFELDPPATGIVVGASTRAEGYLTRTQHGTTEQRGRTIPVVEVAVAPRTRGTARNAKNGSRAVIVAVHENDVTKIPTPRGAKAPPSKQEQSQQAPSREVATFFKKPPFKGHR